MALTTEMMNLLIAEYFNDPKELGYRKYGRMDGNKFYVPQIAALLNESRAVQHKTCLHDDNVECSSVPELHGTIIVRGKKPPRISYIFQDIEGAPNIVTEQDIIETFNYFSQLSPEEVQVVLLIEN